MGKRGPKPTPTAILKLRGAWRGELNKHEPQPPKCKNIQPPKYLSDRAKVIWGRIFPIVRDMKVMTVADVNALGRYCDTLAIWKDISDFVNKHGVAMPVIEEDFEGDGKERVVVKKRVVGFKQYPQAKQYLEYSASLSGFEQSFGLTPSARSRLTIELPGNLDGKETSAPAANGKADLLRTS